MLSDSFAFTCRYSWRQLDNGNYVHRSDAGIIATVFRHVRYKNWRCVINTVAGGHHVQEAFESPEAAIRHAEELIPKRGTLRATPKKGGTIGRWGQQAVRYGGAPSYGRHFGMVSVSVRRAESGHWLYVPYAGPASYEPRGFYPSPDEAMAAADREFLDHHHQRQ